MTLANTKAEIVRAVVDAGLVESEEAAETYTKAELLTFWEG